MKKTMKRWKVLIATMMLVLFCSPVIVAHANCNPKIETWWDETEGKEGVVRCTEVPEAEEYIFTLYKDDIKIVSKSSDKNKYDFAKELGKNFYDRKSKDFYCTVQVAYSKSRSQESVATSNRLTKKMWKELYYYCSSKNIKVDRGENPQNEVDTIKIYTYERVLPQISVSLGAKITNCEWAKTQVKTGEVVELYLTIEPEEAYEILLLKGKNSIELPAGMKLKSLERDGQVFNLEISYTVPGKLQSPEDAYWDARLEKVGVARCEPVENAKQYVFELYQGSELIQSYKTNKNKYDFEKDLKKFVDNWYNKRFYFRVKAVGADNVQDSNYTYSKEFTPTNWEDFEEYLNNK